MSGKGRDFNARVGRSTDADDGIGTFGEDTCNRSGITFLTELELGCVSGLSGRE